MELISSIWALFGLYTALILITMIVARTRPGIYMYPRLKAENLKILTYVHAICIMTMLLPVWMLKDLPVFLLTFPDKISMGQTITFLVVFGGIGFFPWKKIDGQIHEPETPSTLPALHVFLYAISRLCFLVAYEWFFRGLLLINLSMWLGMSTGIILNTIIYVLAHAHKGKKEMIGCIPLGILLCVFTSWWHSIWPAVIFHLQIGIINEWPVLHQFILPKKQTAL